MKFQLVAMEHQSMLEKERDRLVDEIDSLQSRLDFISRRRNESKLINSASFNEPRLFLLNFIFRQPVTR